MVVSTVRSTFFIVSPLKFHCSILRPFVLNGGRAVVVLVVPACCTFPVTGPVGSVCHICVSRVIGVLDIVGRFRWQHVPIKSGVYYAEFLRPEH